MKIWHSGIWQKNIGIRLSNIRINRLHYALAYAMQLIMFPTLWKMHGELFRAVGPIDGRSVNMVIYMVTSLIAILIWKKEFKPQVWFWAIGFLITFFIVIFLPEGNSLIIAARIFYIFYGGIMSVTRCGFAYATNNSEKAISLIFVVILEKLLRILFSFDIANSFILVVVPTVCTLIMVTSLLLYKEQDFEVIEKVEKKDQRGFYWGFVYFMVYFWVGNTVSAYPSDNPVFRNFGILGTAIGVLLLVLMLFVFKINSFHMWNVFFIATIVRYVSVMLNQYMNLDGISGFSSGMMTFGWPLSLYMLACAQRHYADYKLLKKSTLIYVVASPIISFEGTIVDLLFPGKEDIIVLFSVIIGVAVVVMLFPYSNKYFFSKEWLEQLTDSDMKLIGEKVEEKDAFEKWNLSPRQKEVAMLLLSGLTRRQISGELKLSESTVKLHTSELYKKLNINSRIELFRLFGVQGAPDTEE